ncbi:DNA mismatch repair protein MutL [Natranaerovirga pectinivora]|uniref:DNA mismatch repair protein MutL n=1 Tax=Natranaerovirga pectinivora TaxID=682400 RepID=A0A4R3MLK9_9FIRM|nr:DNA mismatch repair endonuclease MutL [Natranaerovirga pectinivora]TCT14994.1 DNA mismatch repair protein MutL [Natranaerovirga pectinivora]
MSTIKLLDQHTINKIAAGEVVERPASVVKELVENSIDAKSSAITVEIKEGGIQFIRITDNGLGINKGDITTAFLRHSTSKIKSIEDLFTVSSLGFRGEALASIASVSQVEVISKTREEITGVRYVIQGGNEISKDEIGCPEGTTIIVRNLFFNTPARRKFLKSPGTEAGHISDLLNRLSLSHPHISFKYIYNNQVKLHTSGNNQIKDVIFNIYGKDIAKNIIPINYKTEEVEITGFIGKPQISRSNRNYESTYINGRYIKSTLIQKALEEGYKTYLPMHKYPFCVLHYKIESSRIDVNVHPTKMEIRFNNSEELFQLTKKVIIDGLRQIELIPEITLDKEKENKTIYQKGIPEPFEKEKIKALNTTSEKVNNEKDYILKDSKDQELDRKKETTLSKIKVEKNNKDNNQPSKGQTTQNTFVKENINNYSEVKESESKNPVEQLIINEPLLSKSAVSFYQIIGQLFNTYWIVEFKEKFYLIDQHAAHERILYEKILSNIKKANTSSQPLLQPLIIDVDLKEQEVIKKYKRVFEELGFVIEDFGGDSYAIRAVPYILGENLKPEVFLEILDLLSDENYINKFDILLERVALMACKAAVKANNNMSFMETKKLIDDLLNLENPYTCPHGRPTIISMTKYELERKFKRIQ